MTARELMNTPPEGKEERPSPPASPDVAEVVEASERLKLLIPVLETEARYSAGVASMSPMLNDSWHKRAAVFEQAPADIAQVLALIERLVRDKAELEAERNTLQADFNDCNAERAHWRGVANARNQLLAEEVARAEAAEAKLSQLEASPGAGPAGYLMTHKVDGNRFYSSPENVEFWASAGYTAEPLFLSAAPSSPASPPEDVGALREQIAGIIRDGVSIDIHFDVTNAEDVADQITELIASTQPKEDGR